MSFISMLNFFRTNVTLGLCRRIFMKADLPEVFRDGICSLLPTEGGNVYLRKEIKYLRQH